MFQTAVGGLSHSALQPKSTLDHCAFRSRDFCEIINPCRMDTYQFRRDCFIETGRFASIPVEAESSLRNFVGRGESDYITRRTRVGSFMRSRPAWTSNEYGARIRSVTRSRSCESRNGSATHGNRSIRGRFLFSPSASTTKRPSSVHARITGNSSLRSTTFANGTDTNCCTSKTEVSSYPSGHHFGLRCTHMVRTACIDTALALASFVFRLRLSSSISPIVFFGTMVRAGAFVTFHGPLEPRS